jgi:hypothetical protein
MGGEIATEYETPAASVRIYDLLGWRPFDDDDAGRGASAPSPS